MAERSAVDDDFVENEDLGPDGELLPEYEGDDTQEFVPPELVDTDPTEALPGENSTGSTEGAERTPATTRVKDPVYHVFRLRTYVNDKDVEDLWEKLTQDEHPVRASSRRKAIVKATAGQPERCFAVPAKEFNPINYKGSRQATIDEFES